MCEMKAIAIALLERNVATGCNAEALDRLNAEDMVFAGQPSFDPYENVPELVRTYGLRLAICRERNLVVPGMQDLVDNLENLDASAKVKVWPFFSNDYAVTLFVIGHHQLVGCVTVPRNA